MNGIHDMGGMHCFGPVVREDDEPVFHEAWEGRAWGMVNRFRAKVPMRDLGINRAYIESIPPETYLRMSYYERFLDATIRRAIDVGVITAEELEAQLSRFEANPAAPVATRFDPDEVLDTRRRLTTQLMPSGEGRKPRFEKGDAVMAINVSRVGHNRLPRYIRGKQGIIERVNGLYPIEDEKAFDDDPTPQAVYTVGFDGVEVWGLECEANLRVYLELWEGYLEPVPVTS